MLEGEESAVRALYEHVKRNPRHQNVMAYADKAIVQRAFTDWSMTFNTISTAQLSELAGYLVPEDVVVEITRLGQTDAQMLDLLRSFVLPS